jgi:glycolate oxidase subunit GlcD
LPLPPFITTRGSAVPVAAAAGPALLRDLRRLLGPRELLVDAAARAVYARDASHLAGGPPLGVALPRDAAQAAAVVAACARHGVPWVARGAGTGLSGGAVPPAGALVIGLARLDRCIIAAEAGRADAGAGVVNERLSRAARPYGLCFAPDPSSQSAATLGGNVAENAGGPHTLKVGVTLNHVLALEWVDSEGQPCVTGSGLPYERGFDLRALLIGSEGTLGLVTSARVRLTPEPPALTTLLALFPRLDDATAAVVALMGTGLLPEAVEMVDQAMLEAVEEAFHFGFPTDVEAAMIVEFGGLAEAVAEDAARAARLLGERGAREVRRAADDEERAALWRCRKKAFGAVGRLAPNYVTMDIVVPLARLPEIVRQVGEIGRRRGVRVATVFHAGDGNLHPGVHYDDRDADLTRRAHLAADEILAATLALDGSVTGEHGVGLEKLHVVGRQLDPVAADLMRGVKQLFDPRGLVNPGKALPPAPLPGAPAPARASATAPTEIRFAWDSLTVRAPGEAPLAEIQALALARGLWIPCGAVFAEAGGVGLGAASSLREAIDRGLPGPSLLGTGPLRDSLLEVWAETGNGRALRAGAPVFKNVAGYDLARLLCGAGGALARVTGATLQLKPLPETVAAWRAVSRPGAPPPDLAPLARELATWGADLAGAVCAGRWTPDDGWSLLVVAGGRDRPWDLDRRAARLAALLGPAGLRDLDETRLPFAQLATLATQPWWPAWTRVGGDWDLLAPSGAPSGWPGGAGEGVVFQTAPRLAWVARSSQGAGSPELHHDVLAEAWQRDAIVRDGVFTEPPPPIDRRSLPLLAGLKALFDPGDRLPRPSWLPRPPAEAP